MADKLFFVGIKGLIRNEAGEILLLQANISKHRGNVAPYWDLPGGRIDDESTEVETLQREIDEELGKRAIVQAVYLETVMSNKAVPLADGSMIGLLLRIWKIELDKLDDLRLSHEHDQVGWFSPQKSSELLSDKYPQEFCQTISALDET